MLKEAIVDEAKAKKRMEQEVESVQKEKEEITRQ